MRFTKAHGLGNDFILVAESAAPEDPSAWTRRLCDRHRGIGGDGVVLHAPESDGVQFRLLNADGLPGEISGNGVRCLAALALREGWAKARHVVHTVVGPKAVEVTPVSGVYRVEDLGIPALASRQGPIALEPALERVIDLPVEAAGRSLRITASSMGNPHCAVFCDTVAGDALQAPSARRSSGTRSSRTARTSSSSRCCHATRSVSGSGSVEWATRRRPARARRAPSSPRSSPGVRSAVCTICDGGTLEIEWPEGGSLKQTGEAELLFDGEWTAE